MTNYAQNIGEDPKFFIDSPAYFNIPVANITLSVGGVLALALIGYLMKRTRQKKHDLVTPSKYALFNESYCVLTLDILNLIHWHLILCSFASIFSIFRLVLGSHYGSIFHTEAFRTCQPSNIFIWVNFPTVVNNFFVIVLLVIRDYEVLL